MNNTIQDDLPFDKYLANPAISCSQLKHLDDCLAKFKYFVLEKNQQTDTEAMKTGRAFHTLMLEPKLFDDEYAIVDKVKGCGPVWKAKKELEIGKKVLFDTEILAFDAMKESILAHDLAGPYLTGTRNEASIFWDAKVGDKTVNCRGRIDAIKEVGKKFALVDIKTTEDASTSAFSSSTFKFKYHMQAAFYMDGFARISGNMPEIFVFIAVEKNPPYLCAVHRIPAESDTLEAGRKEYTEALEKYLEGKENDKWPGYEGSSNIMLPAWYK